jgi:KipI family sensor histidine kinase inhibitor
VGGGTAARAVEGGTAARAVGGGTAARAVEGGTAARAVGGGTAARPACARRGAGAARVRGPAFTLRRAGERGVLVDLAGNAPGWPEPTDAPAALAAAARAALGGVLEDAVAGHATVLLLFARPAPAAAALRPEVEGWLEGADEDARAAADAPALVIATTYDGPDLADVAAHAGLSPEEVVRRHQATTHRVAFLGFAPGFAYLVGGDELLRPARLDDPRPSVPAGSVGLAGSYCAVYPRASPGGWRLIGRTTLTAFDPDADPPTPFAPGLRVRFEAA